MFSDIARMGLFDSSYIDGILSIGSGIIPGKEMFSYDYDDYWIEGNTLFAKHENYSDTHTVNEDGSHTDVPTDGIDTFLFNSDGTVDVVLKGVCDARSELYWPKDKVLSETCKIADFLGDYVSENYSFRLGIYGDCLTIENQYLMYPYEEYWIEGNTLKAKHSQFSEYYSIDEFEDSQTLRTTYYETDGIDTFVLEDDGTVSAMFSGYLNWANEKYQLGVLEWLMIPDLTLEDFLGQYISGVYYSEDFQCLELGYSDGTLWVKSAISFSEENEDSARLFNSTPIGVDTVLYNYDYFCIKGNTLTAKHSEYSDRYNVKDSYEPTDGIDIFTINEGGSMTVNFTGELEPRFMTYGKYEGEISVFDLEYFEP